jgi:hypothetical protein
VRVEEKRRIEEVVEAAEAERGARGEGVGGGRERCCCSRRAEDGLKRRF